MDQFKFLKPSKRHRLKRRDKRLSEELIECRRGNGGDHNKKLRETGEKKQAKNDATSDTPRFRASYRDKRNYTYQNDNLEPLIRFLQSHTGQAWDQVYSKLCQQLDKRSSLGLHVFEQVRSKAERRNHSLKL